MSSTRMWHRSSYSDYEGGNCVEVAASTLAIHVRDSKDKTGPQLCFSPDAWAAFLAFAAEAQVSAVE
ncbi:DUF397 domain-containing protein [Kitasatospora sp. NPDC050463]|uniref:DUF397 domain-containing protein n=1 Tax=Kitasatospora sp. NPDC050463 TaxID=3155786 RepID=UPI0033F0DCB9